MLFVLQGKDASIADPRGSVREAINDVAIIEAIFKSSALESFTHVEDIDFRP